LSEGYLPIGAPAGGRATRGELKRAWKGYFPISFPGGFATRGETVASMLTFALSGRGPPAGA